MRSGDGQGRGESIGAAPSTRRRLVVAGVALLAVSAGVLAMHGSVVESAVAAAIADPASILAARSPGARASGALAQTKLAQTKRRYAKSGIPHLAGPTERVLGQARTRPTGALPLGDAVDPVIGTLVDIPQNAFGGIGDGSPLSGPTVVAFGGPPVTCVGVIGGGGGVGGGGGGGDTPVTPPVSAVPEPSTWLMTILGFFAAGIGLRRRRAVGVGRGVVA